MTVKIVDAAVQYDYPYTDERFILVICNALYVHSISNNLIPPFMMRKAGIRVNGIPKIHVEDPTVDDHSLYFPETRFRITLALWGVFSYFPTSQPFVAEMTHHNET